MTLMRSITTRRGPVRDIARLIAAAALALPIVGGCATQPKYGTEVVYTWPGGRTQVWAIAPAVNLSGQREVDPLLQSDVLYHKLQEVRGLTIVPVDRVAQVFAALRIDQLQSPTQAALVCEALGCDALVVPTVTAYDPYDPPKWGGSLQVFRFDRSAGPAIQNVDARELVRQAAPDPAAVPRPPTDAGFVQAVGMFDAANGTVREALLGYARGRNDPVGPLGAREYLLSMDRYAGFAYHTLIGDLIRSEETARKRGPAAARGEPVGLPKAKAAS